MVIVVIGANGSGKSRLGKWIELDAPRPYEVHRVSAQKSLQIPPSTDIGSLEAAEAELLFGYAQVGQDPIRIKVGYRWGGNPVLHHLNDYNALLKVLFADHYEQLIRDDSARRTTNDNIPLSETKLIRVQNIWKSVLPHRTLTISAGKLEARAADGVTAAYNGSEMSDGERVVFYLIGQCVAAPRDAVIVIDEPEIHLHKAIQAPLWSAIESARPDCLFVYITHDLDFAVSRVGATRIWLKAYDTTTGWDWDFVPESGELPDDLLLTLLGGRKPVLFTEGDKGGLDDTLFSQLYPSHTVIPRGGCEQVMLAARAFADLKHLHHLESRAIIDRGYRTEDDVKRLEGQGIDVLGVSEVENLLLLEEVMLAVATYLDLSDPTAFVQSVKATTLGKLARVREELASAFVRDRIEGRMLGFPGKPVGSADITQALSNMLASIDATKLYNDQLAAINNIISQNDYMGALKLYNNKGLIVDVLAQLQISRARFLGVCKLVISKPEGASALAALRKHTPAL